MSEVEDLKIIGDQSKNLPADLYNICEVEDLKITSQWENLLADLLMKIEEYLISYADKVRFRSVCKSWKSALPSLPKLQLPWLLHPCKEEASLSSYGLFNPLNKKTYYLDLPIKIDERIMFRGSSHGWMVSVEGPYDEIYLINPLTRAKIQLPSRSKFPDVKEYCAHNHGHEYSMWNYARDGCHIIGSENVRIGLTDKFIISSNPSLTDDYVVVVIYGSGCRLAYCKHGDEKWTFLRRNEACFSDVIFCKGKILAMTTDGRLRVIEIHPDNPQVKDIALLDHEITGTSVPYIVESSGGLLMVERQVKNSRGTDPRKEFTSKTVHFNVFKLDQLDSPKWCKVTDIGDEMLFVGFNTSVSRSSLEFPELKRNSIYFTDNLFTAHYEGIHGGSDIGVFDLNSESIEPLPGYSCDPDVVWPPPIWFIPAP